MCKGTEAQENLLSSEADRILEWPRWYLYEGLISQAKVRLGGKTKNNHPFLAGKISWVLSNNNEEIIRGYLGEIVANWESLLSNSWRTNRRGQDWRAGD